MSIDTIPKSRSWASHGGILACLGSGLVMVPMKVTELDKSRRDPGLFGTWLGTKLVKVTDLGKSRSNPVLASVSWLVTEHVNVTESGKSRSNPGKSRTMASHGGPAVWCGRQVTE